MKIEDKLLITKVWCLATTIILITSLWLPIVTKSGQAFNEPALILGCGMAIVVIMAESKGWIK